MLERDPRERGAVSGCAEALGLDTASAARIYGRLTASSLLVSNGSDIEVRLDLLRQAAQDLDEINPVVRRLDDYPHLTALFSHGRLTSIPVEYEHLRSLALFLASYFTDGVSYKEPAVNHVVRQVHEDFSALRRMMVDVGVMTRDRSGVYTLSEQGDEPLVSAT
ncbi:DUF2087 domain-containing protein [Actinopolymorpha alba]|uniref:DUF2087 domain-containing protein n=1 Tax=Actinopolymorpha alba TaxID=533267 RepID=UPI0012F67AE5|nr:DUF2087 domain-containing protein [Actinopolymorpha alba]